MSICMCMHLMLPMLSVHAASDGRTSCPAGQYVAQYFDNQSLAGVPAVQQWEAAVHYAGIYSSWPPAGLGPNLFSAVRRVRQELGP